MDGIKDRLNRLGVGKQKEESQWFTGIGEVTITIKHKAPEIIEWAIASDEIDADKDVEILDITNKENENT